MLVLVTSVVQLIQMVLVKNAAIMNQESQENRGAGEQKRKPRGLGEGSRRKTGLAADCVAMHVADISLTDGAHMESGWVRCHRVQQDHAGG